jgi:NAD(P) transhydrogenase
MEDFYDCIVIGSGPGGQRSALAAAKSGKRVAIIERERELGGACVHQGTIPSKTLREAALTLAKLKNSAHVFDFSLRKDIEVATLIGRMESVVNSYTKVIESDLETNGVDILKGRARIRDPQTVVLHEVDGRTKFINTQTIIIATGSRPRHPENIPVDHEHILDSDSILSILYLPESLTVLGGGVIGSEYASIFAMLGVKVTLIDREPHPLMFLDKEITSKFKNHFEANNGTYLGSRSVAKCYWDGATAVVAELEDGTEIRSEKLLVASGRLANTEGLGLDDVKLALAPRGHIKVNDQYETSMPGIYAVGDVIGRPSLASCSMEQGMRAARNSIGLSTPRTFDEVPIGIYSVPEMSGVGIDEATAIERYGAQNVVVGRCDFNQVARGQIMGIKDGLLKMVALKEPSELLGVFIVGDGATELIHIAQFSLIHKAAPKTFLENVMNFPTLAEAYRIAALDLLGWRY